MIRGSIESVTSDAIQGWIFTEDGKVRDRTLLAFQGDLCVGAGKVNTFRGDLADAGMGDGHLGFSFPISIPSAEVGSIVLKLEGSDAILLQNGAFVTTGAAPVASLARSDVRERLAALKWALKHGRIAQGDFDFLRILWSFGVYERGLVRRNAGDETVVTDKPAAVAAALLESYIEMDAQIASERVRDMAGFAAEIARVAERPQGVRAVAVHTTHRATLRVLEGSHIADAAADGAGRAFVDYSLSPENLVVFDARMTVELIMPEGATIDIISATPAAS